MSARKKIPVKSAGAPEKNPSFWAAAALLTLLTLAAFSPAVKHPFINYDDESYITENHLLTQQPLSWKGVQMAMTATHTGDWHPLVWISFMLEKHFFGLNPAAFHTVNIILHLFNVLLIFYVFRRATGAFWPSFFLAALFAVHPLRAESVAWVSERKDVLSGIFIWLTLGSYLIEKKEGDKRWHYASVLFFILGIMSKPVVVTVPLLLLLLDFWPLQRITRSVFWQRLAEKTPFILLSVFSCVMAVSANAGIKGFYSMDVIPMTLRFTNALISYFMYLYQSLWPFHLAVFYPFPHPQTASAFWVLLAAAGFFLTGLWTWKKRDTAPYLWTGWMWYVLTLIPMLGIVRVSNQAMADRYTYIPHIGLGLMAVWSFTRLPLKTRKTAGRFLGGLTLIFWTVLCRQQVGYWSSPEALNRHAVEVTQGNYVAYGNLGYYHMKRKEYQLAEDYYQKALNIRPFYAFALNSMGALRIDQGRLDDAEKIFRDSVERWPNRHRPYYYLGLIFASQKKYELAEKNLLHAIRLRGNFLIAKKSLAHVYLDMEDYEKARVIIGRLLADYPYDTLSNFMMGRFLQGTGRAAEAVPYYEKAAEGTPTSPRALNRLALLWMREGQHEKAKAFLSGILTRNPGYFQAAIALSNVYLEEKNYEEAARAAARALAMRPGSETAARLLKDIEAARKQPPASEGQNNQGHPVLFGTGLEINSPQDLSALMDVLAQRTGTN